VKLLTKEQRRSIGRLIIPFLGSMLIRFIYFTNKKRFHAPDSLDDSPLIIAFWHGELLMAPFPYLKYKKRNPVKVLISDHYDGELIARTMGYFGFGTQRGSSARGGARALIGTIKALKDGVVIGITPDGPKGPRHEVQDGIIMMAQKTKAKIVFVEIKPSSYWQLKSWDKFIIPKPFGSIDFYMSDPKDISGMDIKEASGFIKEGLLKHER